MKILPKIFKYVEMDVKGKFYKEKTRWSGKNDI
jgi:hypothetical protein